MQPRAHKKGLEYVVETRGSLPLTMETTAFKFLDDREKCLASGCDLYISKPINPANFISQLSAFIR